jgi:hypothetical protein
MRNAPDVPELIEDEPVGLMHRLGDLTPRLHLLTAVYAGSPCVTLALHTLGCLAHDQCCGCALRAVAGGGGPSTPRARERVSGAMTIRCGGLKGPSRKPVRYLLLAPR